MAKNDKKVRVEIAYLGEDKSYWDQVKTIYKTDNPNMDFFFFEWFNLPKDTVADTYEKVHQTPLNIIYLDFCKRDAEILYLAKIIANDNYTKSMVTVGLVDNLTSKDIIREAIMAGIKMIQIKGTEVRAAVFQPLDVATGQANIPAYAVAKLGQSATLKQRFRLRSLNAKSMKIESDHPFAPTEDVRLVSSFLKNSRMFSHWHKVKNSEDKNLYSNAKFIHDVDFYFIDPQHVLDKIKEEERLEKEALIKKAKKEAEAKAKRESDSLDVQKNLEEFVVDNQDRYVPKKVKILIVDKKLSVLSQSDKNIFYDYPFKMYLQSYLKKPEIELKHRLPQVLAFTMDVPLNLDEEEKLEYTENLQKVDKIIGEIKAKIQLKGTLPEDWTPDIENVREGLLALRATPESVESKRKVQEALDQYFGKKTANDIDALKAIMAAIKKIEGYSPVVLVFNAIGLTSDGLRKEFGHEQVICQNAPFNFNQLMSLAQIFQKNMETKKDKELTAKVNALKKKDPGKYRKITKADLEGGARVYFDERRPESVVEHESKVLLHSISESELTFSLLGKDEKYEIPMYSIFEMNFPVNMWITVLPFPKNEKQPNKKPEGYRAFIHMVGEIEKRDLRRFVNSVFFADKDEAKRKELEEFEAMKQRVIEQRNPQPEASEGGEMPLEGDENKKSTATNDAADADAKKKAS